MTESALGLNILCLRPSVSLFVSVLHSGLFVELSSSQAVPWVCSLQSKGFILLRAFACGSFYLACNSPYCMFTIVSMCAKSLPSCPTLYNPTDCFSPGSFVHGIFQASILVAISSSRDLPNSGIKPVSLRSPALAGRFFTISTTWEAFPQLSKGVE